MLRMKGTLVLALYCALSFPAHAADPVQSPDEGIRRQEERAKVLQESLTPPLAPPTPQAVVTVSSKLPDEAPCFKLRQIILTGPDVDTETVLVWLIQYNVTESFVGQCAGLNGVNQISDAVNAWLLRKGYATSRVVLPEQNLSSGTLNLQLHVGRVGEVRMIMAGTISPDERWGGWRSAFAPVSDPGDVLNIHDVQQGVEQMNRLPSQQVTTRLEPGEAPDTSDIVIQRETSGRFLQRLHGGLSIDNSGSETLGRTQVSLWTSLDNPLGINDLLNINGNTNAERPDAQHKSQTFAGSYSIPWGRHTFTASLSRNDFAQRVAGTTATFLSSGNSTTGDFKWQYQLLQTSSGKLAIYGDLGLRRARSYLEDVELLVQRRRTVNLETGFNWQQLLGPAKLGINYGFRNGRPWFGAEDDYPAEAELTLRPRLHLFDLSLASPISIKGYPFSVSSTLHGQYTRDATIVNDQISIGNRYTVRGFNGDKVLLAESGVYWRNELASALPSPDGFKLQGYWGLDAGRLWGRSDSNLLGHDLAGTTLGLRGQWKSFQTDLAVATPLYSPKGFDPDPVSFYGSLIFAF